jgi:pantoate--beta-alanine ligase
MTQLFREIPDWQKIRAKLGAATLGFVPTMGALHEGHLELVRRSKRENDLTLVSIFVNPTQFNDPSDLTSYPRTTDEDLQKLQAVDTDFVLLPEPDAIYPDSFRFQVEETRFSRELCGAHRPGHFKGMLTVVMKLLNIARATRAYFGEKDYQQLTLVKDMVEAFFMSTEIIACPTIRDVNGLALSSRNQRLKENERELAAFLPRVLSRAGTPAEAHASLEQLGFSVEYVEDRAKRRLAAVKLGSVRLIDNVAL